MARALRPRVLLCLPLLVVAGACGDDDKATDPRHARSGVDLYMTDSASSTAAGDAYASGVQGVHWESPDVKIDAAPFEAEPATDAEFDAFRDEAPGADNRVYVRVRNRGGAAARDVAVTLYRTPAGTMLPRLGGPELRPAATARVAELPPRATRIVSFGANAIGSHQCLVVGARAASDAAGRDEGVPADAAVTRFKHLVARNMQPIRPTRPIDRTIAIRNPTPFRARAELSLDVPDGWKATLSSVEPDRPFRLAPGETRRVRVSLTPPDAATGSVLRIRQQLTATDGSRLTGGMSYVVRAPA